MIISIIDGYFVFKKIKINCVKHTGYLWKLQFFININISFNIFTNKYDRIIHLGTYYLKVFFENSMIIDLHLPFYPDFRVMPVSSLSLQIEDYMKASTRVKYYSIESGLLRKFVIQQCHICLIYFMNFILHYIYIDIWKIQIPKLIYNVRWVNFDRSMIIMFLGVFWLWKNIITYVMVTGKYTFSWNSLFCERIYVLAFTR